MQTLPETLPGLGGHSDKLFMRFLHACDNCTTSNRYCLNIQPDIYVRQCSSLGHRNGERSVELSLESRQEGKIMVIHCRGRLVYREEAAAVSRMVGEALRNSSEVVLDLEEVQNVDSAGLGELIVAHISAEEQGKTVKVVGANRSVSELLELTNMSSVFAVYPSLADAMDTGEGWTPMA
jgi:anti-sigma B factor antagonist